MIAQRKQQLGKFMDFWENIRSLFFREESKPVESEANGSEEAQPPVQAEQVVKPVKAPIRFKVFVQRDEHCFLEDFTWDQDKPINAKSKEDLGHVKRIVLQRYGEYYDLEEVQVEGRDAAVIFVARLENMRKGGIYTEPKQGSPSIGY